MKKKKDATKATTNSEPKPKKKRRVTSFGTDQRRKHRHWQVTVFYRDGERFARIYTDRGRATRFASRQKKSPVVRSARVLQVH